MSVNPTVTQAELLWREWILGEGRYKGRGPRSRPRPNVGYGDPTQGQEPVPQGWWIRLEEFLAKRNDNTEPPAPPTNVPPGQLSPHFNVREFDCHDGRKVPAAAIPGLTSLCAKYLEPMRDRFGSCHVLSGYRHKAYNASIGGAKFSQHIYDESPESVAADLTFQIGTPSGWAAMADKLGAGGVGSYSSFVHVDNRATRARWTG